MNSTSVRHGWSRAAEALRVVREAQRRHATGYPRLLARFFDVYARRRYSLREIAKLDLLGPRHTRAWLERNTSKRRQVELQCRLNPVNYWILTEDKAIFYRFCLGSGLPVPRFFGSISVPRHGASAALTAKMREHAIHVLENADATDLIVKPAHGLYGIGVVALRRENGNLLDSGGACRKAGDIPDWLATVCDYDTFVVQERLDVHPSLQRLSGTRNLQTVRMVTYVRRDGRPVIGCCQLKIIGGNSLVDNFGNGRLGNLIGDIPAAGGRLSRVHGAAPDGSSTQMNRHPRTDMVFDGFSIPFWDQACALVERAALVFLPLRTVGWDVAITPRGPVLIEGNVTWDPPQLGEEVSSEILDAIKSDRQF
jgi:hypothetical protein